jgi:hypothetical protein
LTGAITCCNAGRLSFIGGGYRNCATGCTSTIGGGNTNTTSGELSTIGGGSANTTSALFSTIGGGQSNIASGNYSFVGGGQSNTASDGYATIGGGATNTASGSLSTIGGGFRNTASNSYSSIAGGYCNTASDNYTTIGVGKLNNINSGSAYSSILGGKSNYTCAYANVHLIGSAMCATVRDTTFVNNLCVFGNITKSTGSFSISHPDPSKTKTHKLIHNFVESPTAGDNIYRYEVEVKDGVAEIQLPDYYKFLNENTQIWVTAKNGFGVGYGIINDDMTNITILADKDLTYNILVIGTRKDEVAKKYWKGVEVEKNETEKQNNN